MTSEVEHIKLGDLLTSLYTSKAWSADQIKNWAGFESFVLFCKSEETFIEYTGISKFVYLNEQIIVTHEPETFMPELLSALEPRLKNHGKAWVRAQAICDRVCLSQTQLNSLNSTEHRQKIDKLTSDLEEKNKELADTKGELQKAQGELTEAKQDIVDATSRLYSGFVSVLGIFIAISFSLFGSATLFHAAIKSSEVNKASVGQMIILVGIITLLIYLLVSGLFFGIHSILNRKIESIKMVPISLGVVLTTLGIMLAGFVYDNPKISPQDIPNSALLIVVYTVVAIIVWVSVRKGIVNHLIELEREKQKNK